MRYEDEWVSRTPIVRPPVGVQLLVPAAAEFLATEGDLEAIFSLGFVTSAAESAAVSTNATTLRRLRLAARRHMDRQKATFRDFRKLSREWHTREKRHRASRDLRPEKITFAQ